MIAKKNINSGLDCIDVYSKLRGHYPKFEIQYLSVKNKKTIFKVFVNAKNAQYVLWDSPIKEIEQTVNVINKVYPVIRKAFFTKVDMRKFPVVICGKKGCKGGGKKK